MDFVYFRLIDVSRTSEKQDLAIKIRLKCFFFRLQYLFSLQFFLLPQDIHHSLSNRIFRLLCLTQIKLLFSHLSLMFVFQQLKLNETSFEREKKPQKDFCLMLRKYDPNSIFSNIIKRIKDI